VVTIASVDRCREVLGRSIAESAQRAARPAVGCFPVYTPFELFHAAGALPVGLIGAGGTLEIAHADARFQSFVCSIAKSTLELGLQGRLEDLEVAVFHSICDVARNLASVFERNFPDLHVEYIHLPQSADVPEAEEYLAAEYRRVLRDLEAWLGCSVRDEDIRASVRLYNDARRRMRALYALRAEEPERLSAAESLLLVRAGTLIPPEEHARLLDRAVQELRERDVRPMDRVRVVVEGAFCEQPPLGLVEVLEGAGCYVVDDDFLAGWRWFTADVGETGDPVRALARAYLARSRVSSVRHDPARPRPRDLVERVKRSGAQAVIFMPAKFCEPALFDQVLHRRALDAAGIPHLQLEFEEKMWTFERARGEVETFVESLLFD
jgi:benzoyl-CoA reductase subunit C